MLDACFRCLGPVTRNPGWSFSPIDCRTGSTQDVNKHDTHGLLHLPRLSTRDPHHLRTSTASSTGTGEGGPATTRPTPCDGLCFTFRLLSPGTFFTHSSSRQPRPCHLRAVSLPGGISQDTRERVRGSSCRPHPPGSMGANTVLNEPLFHRMSNRISKRMPYGVGRKYSCGITIRC